MTEVAKRRWTHWYRCPYIEYLEGAVGPDVPEPPAPPDPPLPPVPSTPDGPEPPAPPQPDGTPEYGTRLLKYVKGHRLLSGDDVRAVQTRLAQLGYEPGKIDGMYGALSEAAVRALQTDAGIAVDGMVGPDTRQRLR